MSPWPGGHHSSSGSCGHFTGIRPSGHSFGSAFWMKSSGSPSTGRSGVLRRGCRATPRDVRKEFISTSGSSTPHRSRSASTCSAMMSRKVRPSLTSSADFAPVMPMPVPRPPLSLMTAVFDSAARASSSVTFTSPRVWISPSGSMESSGIVPCAPACELLVVVLEDPDRLGPEAPLAHQVDGCVQPLVTHGHHLTMASHARRRESRQLARRERARASVTCVTRPGPAGASSRPGRIGTPPRRR